MEQPSRPVSSRLVPNGGADWRSEADRRIERLRKGDLVVEVRRGHDGAPLKDARVEYRLKRRSFLFGTAIAHAPFADTGDDGLRYRQFILDHFSALVCENEMKWYATEVERGREDYARADALLAFADQNGLAMRGHCLFWELEKHVQPWLSALDQSELRAAILQPYRRRGARPCAPTGASVGISSPMRSVAGASTSQITVSAASRWQKKSLRSRSGRLQ
jgi:hypothetical protein